ncbi:MAG: ComF family protein [Bacillota bacterium]
MNKLFDNIISLVYPERCLFCNAVLPNLASRSLCAVCEKEFIAAGFLCPYCEVTLPANAFCICRPLQPSLHSLFALAKFEQQWRLLLHNLKYYGRRSLGRPLGRWLAYELNTQQVQLPDLVVPIPLHRDREKERGFNQSALIAKHLAMFLEVPFSPLLDKHKKTLSQTALSRRDRQNNIHGAFSLAGPIKSGSTVLLVDDIYTTGSTMMEAADILYRHGAEVHGAVVAYNPLIKN